MVLYSVVFIVHSNIKRLLVVRDKFLLSISHESVYLKYGIVLCTTTEKPL